jgi:putative membrane-bound dehydrogenase-like protein
VKIELFAEHPQIVTPTGIDVDSKGRVWAIESNTHFPPEGYKGHPTDRVLVMSDTDGDGKADRIIVFTDGLKHTMSVTIRPSWLSATPRAPVNSVYVATRREILLFHDDDGDNKADRKDQIIHLETKGDYPHNGLAGFAFDALGWMYFGFGENLGAEYKIVGSDGATLSGGGEGGCVCRCRPDGAKLERWATGFWNPHASCFDAFGRLFTVDNDPDSRPPCRLMHIIRGGDYGYRFRNGRAGLHPFTSWNGEIPGTLPMVAGTGEAPSGILAYESDVLADDFRGNLIATSWGDHRIDRFRLKPHGASFTSSAEPLIVGGEDFRPVGIACAPDGSLYFTDWVKRDYTLHSQGRVWRISSSTKTKSAGNAYSQNSQLLNVRRQAARDRAAIPGARASLLAIVGDRAESARSRLETLWSLVNLSAPNAPVALTSAKLFATCDVVATAAGWFINSPLLPMDQKELHVLAGDLLVERMLGRPKRLADGGALLAILSQCRFAPGDRLVPLALSVDDPFILSVMVQTLARDFDRDGFVQYLSPEAVVTPRVRVAMLLAARQRAPRDTSLVELGLADDQDPDVRRLAVQWVAEEQLRDLRPRVEAVFNSNAVTSDLFMAALAALEILDGGDAATIDKTPATQYVMPLLRDEGRSSSVRAQALRLISPAEPALDAGLLRGLLNGSDPLLQQEAVRTLQLASVDRAAPLLSRVADDAKRDGQLRADAVVGLAEAARSEKPGGPTRKLLARLLASDDAALRRESLRSVRRLAAHDPGLQGAMKAMAKKLKPPAEASVGDHELADQMVLADPGQDLTVSVRILLSKKPLNRDAWLVHLHRRQPDDVDAGRRLFYHSNGPGCYKCHTVNGRGGRVGPDLSTIGRSHSREKLFDSMFEPGKEIAPQYVTWSFETADGKAHAGMIVHENEGKTIIGDAEGKLTELKTLDIVERSAQQKSVMPDNLLEQMTIQEFRDLIAYLESLK